MRLTCKGIFGTIFDLANACSWIYWRCPGTLIERNPSLLLRSESTNSTCRMRSDVDLYAIAQSLRLCPPDDDGSHAAEKISI